MKFETDEEIQSLLIEAGRLSQDASRQVRRKAVRSARERLAGRDLELEQAKRLFGWKTEEERLRDQKKSRSAMSAAAAMMMLVPLATSRR